MLYQFYPKCIVLIIALFSSFHSLNSSAVNFINSGPPFENMEKIGPHDLANLTYFMQDSLGFIWFGEGKKLLRFDGSEIKAFPLTGNMKDLEIASIVEGQDGRLWIANSKLEKEIGVLDLKTSTFHFIDIQKKLGVNLGPIVDQNVPAEVVYKNQQLYVSIGQHILIIDEASFVLQQTIPLPLADDDYVIRIKVTNNGDIWFSSLHGKGVSRIDKNGIAKYQHQADDDTTISANLVFNIFEDSKGRVWFSTFSGLDLYQADSDNFKHYKPITTSSKSSASHAQRANVLLNVVEDDNGNLWLALINSGLVKFQPEKEIFEHYRSLNNIDSTISTDILYWGGVFIDRQQTVWISTSNGLSKLTKQARNIQLWKNIDKNDCFPKRIQQAKQTFIFACGKAVYEYKNSQISHLTTIPHLISSTYHGADKQLWLGTLGGGIYRYNLSTKKLKQYGLGSGDLAKNVIDRIQPDVNGNFYTISQKVPVTKRSGLLKYNVNSDKFSHLETDLGMAITELVDIDKNRLLLIGGFSNKLKQLYWFNKSDQSITQLPIDTGMVFAAIKRQEEILVSSDKLGLISINVNSGQWQQLNKEEKNKIEGLYLKNNTLLISINQALYQVDSITGGKLVKHCITCALPVNTPQLSHPLYGQLRRDHGYLLSNNDFVVSAENSLMTFSVSETLKKKSAPQLRLTDYKVMGKSVLPEPNKEAALLTNHIEYSDNIIIPPNTAYFSFSFSLVGATQPQRINYAYKLEGLNDSWIYTDATHAEAIFSLLPAGDYTLKVKASDENGQWQNGSKELSFDIVVNPPWWQTWWAYTVYCLAILSLFGLFYRVKLAERQRQSALELAATKEQLFANISHEFRTPLTLILGPAKAIESSTTDLQTKQHTKLIARNAKRLLSMVDQLLQLAQLKEQLKEQESAQQVSEIYHFVMYSFELAISEKGLKLEFNESIDESWWVTGTKDALETILSNLIANAIKYTDAQGVVSVAVKEKLQWLEFSVSDTGCGIALDEQEKIFERFTRLENTQNLASGVGIGLALVKELVINLGGQISVESDLGQGSNFIFTLPKAEPQEPLTLTSSNTLFAPETEDVTQAITSSTITNSALSVASAITEDKSIEADDTEGSTTEVDRAVENSKASILIVEDNQEMREFITTQLEKNYYILCATNGQQGFELACQHSPDVIISDVMMPKMDGFELLNAIRNEMAISHIPVILLTAKGDQQSKLRGLSDLADDYITKPFDVQELLSRIDNLLAIRTILQSRFASSNLLSASSSLVTTSNIPEKDKDPISANENLNDKEQQFYLSFKNYIHEQHADRDLSLSKVSKQLAMSDRQLQRKLKAVCGSSFSDMLRDVRLTQGENLLSQGEQIAVIAEQVGFNSSSYFVRCFKAKYGQSPNEYRNSL